MILQICGHLIDTQYIYEISEVKCNWEQVGDDGYERYSPHGCFEIKFLQSKRITIDKGSYNSYKTMHTTEYKAHESKISKQLNNVRDQLICKWKANQLAIPKIEFDENNITS